MRIYTLILFSFSLAYQVNCQTADGQWFKRISKDEFKRLRNKKEKYIPKNLDNNGVIVVLYNENELDSMLIKGIDVSLRKLDASFSERNYFLNKINKNGHLSTKIFKKDAKRLCKYAEQVLLHKTSGLNNFLIKNYRYELRLVIVTEIDNIVSDGWFAAYKPYFYDRLNDRNYDVFMPLNYDLFDLLE